MARQIAATVDGFTPLFDVLLSQKSGLAKAAVFGKVWRYCQMDRGMCSASQERIARELGLSRETVNRQLKALVADGYLEDLAPVNSKHPHLYRDTGKIAVIAKMDVVVTQSHNDVTLSHNDVTQSHYSSDLKSHKETETKEETMKETKQSAGEAIIAGIPATADVANSVSMDDLARSAGIHNQKAPRKRKTEPAPAQASITPEMLNHFAVAAHREIMGVLLDAFCMNQIISKVTDEARWREVLTGWRLRPNWKRDNIAGQLDRYATANPQPAATRQSASEPAGYAALREWAAENNINFDEVRNGN